MSSRDWLMRQRGPLQPPDDIVIVAIDEVQHGCELPFPEKLLIQEQKLPRLLTGLTQIQIQKGGLIQRRDAMYPLSVDEWDMVIFVMERKRSHSRTYVLGRTYEEELL